MLFLRINSEVSSLIGNARRYHQYIANASVNIGKGVILSSASIVDHGATVGNYVHLAAGAMVQKGAKGPDGTKVSSGTIY